jgi:hypothetical protein
MLSQVIVSIAMLGACWALLSLFQSGDAKVSPELPRSPPSPRRAFNRRAAGGDRIKPIEPRWFSVEVWENEGGAMRGQRSTATGRV